MEQQYLRSEVVLNVGRVGGSHFPFLSIFFFSFHVDEWIHLYFLFYM